MIKIALTGSIASGKSTLLKAAENEGYPVFSADNAVAALYESNAKLVSEIEKHFPDAVVAGKVDKTVLAKAIYEDDQTMDSIRQLREIVAPYARAAMNKFFDECSERGEEIVICEVPFLFESDLHTEFNASVNVTASPENQKLRALQRQGMTESKFKKITKAFYPVNIRETLADFNISANQPQEDSEAEFLDFIAKMHQTPHFLQRESRPPIVWVVGKSSSGKTPVAGVSKPNTRNEGISVNLGFEYMSSSEFFRGTFFKTHDDYLCGRKFDDLPNHEKEVLKDKFIKEISEHCSVLLERNPRCNIAFFEAKLRKADRPCVLEGFRNLFEFVNLYDPKQDMVVFLGRKNGLEYNTVFERGVDEIERNVRWLIEAGMAPEDSVVKLSYGEGKIDQLKFSKDENINQPHVIFDNSELSESDYELIDELKLIASQIVYDYFKAKNPALVHASSPPKFDAV